MAKLLITMQPSSPGHFIPFLITGRRYDNDPRSTHHIIETRCPVHEFGSLGSNICWRDNLIKLFVFLALQGVLMGVV